MTDMTAVGGRSLAARRLGVIFAAAALFVGATAFPANGGHTRDVRHAQAPTRAIVRGDSGRWFTDAYGRVVMLRGVNFVEKWAPFTPEADGFDDDDAALIARSGFNTVRLGVAFEFLMPRPGEIDTAYLDSLERTVRILDRHQLLVLVDFHQDGWGPMVYGNGMPAWATLIDDQPNIPAPFPLYYVLNPAIQRAFENFWANRPGPDGVPLQTHYATGMRTVAQRFVHARNVIGYEAMNEPWPGADWAPCVSGCPDFERDLLDPFHARMRAAIRQVDPRRPLFVEPFVLFNFGSANTSLPGAGSGDALSTHVYANSPSDDYSAMALSVWSATRDQAPLLVTEWGAVDDPATLNRLQDQFDSLLVPWIYWSWNGHFVDDSNAPLVPPNLNPEVLDALTRPWPSLVNGTPTSLAFDDGTDTLEFTYSTRRPNGRRASRWLETVVMVPAGRYPSGYRVEVEGGRVTSRPCASRLTVRHRSGVESVTVRVVPAPAGAASSTGGACAVAAA